MYPNSLTRTMLLREEDTRMTAIIHKTLHLIYSNGNILEGNLANIKTKSRGNQKL